MQAAEGGDSFAIPFANGGRESYRASQRCSRRQPFPAFEQRHSDGTSIVTIKILLLLNPKANFPTVAFAIRYYRIHPAQIVANPRRQANPATSVIVVMNIVADWAGSNPSLRIMNGMAAPLTQANVWVTMIEVPTTMPSAMP
jgi:hypothetical protein